MVTMTHAAGSATSTTATSSTGSSAEHHELETASKRLQMSLLLLHDPPAPILQVTRATDRKGLQTHAADRVDVEEEEDPFSLESVQVARSVLASAGLRVFGVWV